MNTQLVVRAGLLLACSACFSAAADPLQEAQVVQREDLASVTSVTISPDGLFLYAAAFNPGNVLTFRRDIATGQLTFSDILTGDALNAAVSVNLSHDARYLVASSFRANCVSLMQRDTKSGELSVLDGPFEGKPGVGGLNFVIDANFSPDDRFIYTASAGGVGVFKMEKSRMEFVQYAEADGRLQGVRDSTLSPDGKWLYAPAYISGTLGVFRRDADTGKLDLVQVIENEGDAVRGIAGAFRVETSRDGKHVYLSSGRFNGDQAVSVFDVLEDGKLKQIQVFENGVNDFEKFKGGNSLVLSADGKMLYVLASVSDRLFRFECDGATGKLKFLGSQQVGELAEPGSAGLCFSPDGKFLYVADEASQSIVVFRIP
jgi:6-phosphogluconolactonase (cycloisomerase 2 family)